MPRCLYTEPVVHIVLFLFYLSIFTTPSKEYAMTRKTIITSLAAIIFATSIPVAAMANPAFHGRYGYNCQAPASCPAMTQLTDEQKAQFDKLHEEHYAAVAPLRDNLMEKRMTLNALSRNPNTTPAELRQLTADITKLRTQIRTVNDEFVAKMEKAGLPCPQFRHHDGYGYGHRGQGMGQGQGMGMGRGYNR